MIRKTEQITQTRTLTKYRKIIVGLKKSVFFFWLRFFSRAGNSFERQITLVDHVLRKCSNQERERVRTRKETCVLAEISSSDNFYQIKWV